MWALCWVRMQIKPFVLNPCGWGLKLLYLLNWANEFPIVEYWETRLEVLGTHACCPMLHLVFFLSCRRDPAAIKYGSPVPSPSPLQLPLTLCQSENERLRLNGIQCMSCVGD